MMANFGAPVRFTENQAEMGAPLGSVAQRAMSRFGRAMINTDAVPTVTVCFHLNENRGRIESIEVRISLSNGKNNSKRANLDQGALHIEKVFQNGTSGGASLSVSQIVIEGSAPENIDSIRILPTDKDRQATWMFQASSRFSDVRALRLLPEPVFLVHQFKKQIKPGDRVYIWECGCQSGITAVAEVLEAPRVLPEPPEQTRLIYDTAKFAGDRFRAKLRVLRTIDPIIDRQQLLSHPGLSTMTILRCPRGTNFRIGPEEATILEDLIEHRRKSRLNRE